MMHLLIRCAALSAGIYSVVLGIREDMLCSILRVREAIQCEKQTISREKNIYVYEFFSLFLNELSMFV